MNTKDFIIIGDAAEKLKLLPDAAADCCVTSPPYYGLRDYGHEKQIGLEQTPELYLARLITVFTEIYRILKPAGTCWIIIGDCYAGSGKGAARYPDKIQQYLQTTNKGSLSPKITTVKFENYKPKNLIGIPWRLAFALQNKGWLLRQDIIYAKNNPMPEPVKDRFTKAHEYIFLLTKRKKYFFDNTAALEPISSNNKNTQDLRTKRDVWFSNVANYDTNHFAAFPENIITTCITTGCPQGGTVIDPFMGTGTTAVVALKQNRHFIGIEINPTYAEQSKKRVLKTAQITKHNFSTM